MRKTKTNDILNGKPKDRKKSRRSTRRLQNNIKTNIIGILCEGEDWTQLVQDKDKWRNIF